MSGLFEDLEAFDASKRVATRKTLAVANKRVDDRVGALLRNASSEADFKARLSLVADDIREIVAAVTEEYGDGIDAASIEKTVLAGWEDLTRGPDGKWTSPNADTQLDGGDGIDIDSELADAPSAVGESVGEGVLASADNIAPSCPSCNSHTTGVVSKDGQCSCHSCGNSWKADGEVVPTGEGVMANTYVGIGAHVAEALETQDVSKDTKPKTDKSKAGDERGHKKRDVKSEGAGSPHPTVEQDIDDEAQYDKKDFLDQTDAVTSQESLPTSDDWAGFTEGGEVGDHTDTWSTNDGQTNPVTAAVDPDTNPITDHLREWEADQQVQAAIAEFEGESR